MRGALVLGLGLALGLAVIDAGQSDDPVTITFTEVKDDGKSAERTFANFVMKVDGVEVRAEAALGRGDMFILRGHASVLVPPAVQRRLRVERPR